MPKNALRVVVGIELIAGGSVRSKKRTSARFLGRDADRPLEQHDRFIETTMPALWPSGFPRRIS
jgi:hypothetical protein